MPQDFNCDKSTSAQVMGCLRPVTSHDYLHQCFMTPYGVIRGNWVDYPALVLWSISSFILTPLRWRHNDHVGVSNHQPHGCLLNRLFRRKSKKTSELRVTGLCAGNSPGTGEFPAQMASYAENVSIWWRHHDIHDTYCNAVITWTNKCAHRLVAINMTQCVTDWSPSRMTAWQT